MVYCFLFRYRTNDLAEIIWEEINEDGLRRMKFKIIGRTDEMLVIRGVNFFPQSLLSVITDFEPEVTRNYRVVAPSVDDKKISVFMETSITDEVERFEFSEKIIQRVSDMMQVAVDINWLNIGEMPETGNKSRYIISSTEEIKKK